jgi:REP element-mobilizing transposase RayT
MERYRFYADGAVYFVTFCVVDWLPVFVSEHACRIVADSLNFCHRTKGLRINAYVIMPTHFHAILFHESFHAGQLETVVTDFRKFTGRELCDYCDRHMPPCFSGAFREAAGDDRQRRFWQPSRHPEQIETESFWRRKLDYLHENPCRKGLVARADYWRFSSASYWLCEPRVANDVSLSALEW